MNSKGSVVDDLTLTLVSKTFHCRIQRKIPKFERIKMEKSNLRLKIGLLLHMYVYVYVYIYIMNLLPKLGFCCLLQSKKRSELPQARTRNWAWQMVFTTNLNQQLIIHKRTRHKRTQPLFSESDFLVTKPHLQYHVIMKWFMKWWRETICASAFILKLKAGVVHHQIYKKSPLCPKCLKSKTIQAS